MASRATVQKTTRNVFPRARKPFSCFWVWPSNGTLTNPQTQNNDRLQSTTGIRLQKYVKKKEPLLAKSNGLKGCGRLPDWNNQAKQRVNRWATGDGRRLLAAGARRDAKQRKRRTVTCGMSAASTRCVKECELKARSEFNNCCTKSRHTFSVYKKRRAVGARETLSSSVISFLTFGSNPDFKWRCRHSRRTW